MNADQRPEDDAGDEAARQVLQDQVSRLPAMTSADVGHVHRYALGIKGSVDIFVKAKPGTDTAALADTLTGPAWKSGLNPLRTMLILVQTGVGAEEVHRNVVIADQAPTLTVKYGPRPSATSTASG